MQIQRNIDKSDSLEVTMISSAATQMTRFRLETNDYVRSKNRVQYMFRDRIMWVAWLCMMGMWSAPLVRGQQDVPMRFPPDILTTLATLQSPKTVLRALKAIAPDQFWDPETRLRKWGYPFESHSVKTEDGYILTILRIPGGRNDSNGTARIRPPVMFQHGLMSCAEFWLVPDPKLSPALILADAGYDVWLSNVRGNHFSVKHEKLKRKDPLFWIFTFHEMGMYDIPAQIDYILNATEQEKLFYVGHSMGNTIFFVAMSMRPEYNAKIRLQLALSPAVFFDDIKSPLVDVLAANVKYIKGLFDSLQTYEFLHHSETLVAMSYLLCNEKATFNKFCAVALSTIVGPLDLNNTGQLGLMLGRGGSGTSGLVLYHFAQQLHSGKFRQLDHKKSKNLKVYGTPDPPEYPLDKVTAPVSIYVAESDYLVPIKAAKHLDSVLPNVVSFKEITKEDEEFFNHFDFGNHPRVYELVVKHMIDTMARF